MRQIDSEPLGKEIHRLKEKASTFGHQDYRCGYISALSVVEGMIASAPVIDAEPVVRCKDCKHWGTGYGGETEHIKVCEYANYMVSENGYCVYGERKMDEEG